MTISTNCAYNNQTHCNIKNLYFNKHKHKHMVNHICWNPSFFPLPNADIHEISNFYQKRHLFIKNYSFFIKNLIDPPYKKLQPQISPFIKNSIFGNNRDPWGTLLPLNRRSVAKNGNFSPKTAFFVQKTLFLGQFLMDFFLTERGVPPPPSRTVRDQNRNIFRRKWRFLPKKHCFWANF